MKNVHNYIKGVQDSDLNNLVLFDNDIKFWGVGKKFAGYGHYKIDLRVEVDGHDITLTKTTTEMELIDHWVEFLDNDCAYLSEEERERYPSPLLTAIEFVYNEDIILELLSEIVEDKVTAEKLIDIEDAIQFNDSQWPPELQDLLKQWMDKHERAVAEVSDTEVLLEKVKELGYTFEYGQDFVPHNLSNLPQQKED